MAVGPGGQSLGGARGGGAKGGQCPEVTVDSELLEDGKVTGVGVRVAALADSSTQ
jgi:hypothetical protein